MAEQKILPTTTLIEYKTDNTVDITAKYNGSSADELPNILSSDISEIVTNLNGVSIIEGELYLNIKNYPNLIKVQLDNNGNFVLFLSLDEENHYSKDVDQGQLLYEKQ